MATLGKCLVFYLRHPIEMNRLYDDPKPKSDGLQDPDGVLEMAQHVGQQASIEVADFLSECAAAFEPHLRAICRPEQTRSRRWVEKDWSIPYRIRSIGQTRRDAFEFGVSIHTQRTAIVPWIWCYGGKRGVEAALQILGPRADGQSRLIDPSCVYLSRIPIPLPDNSDGIPTRPLIEQLVRSVTALTQSDWCQAYQRRQPPGDALWLGKQSAPGRKNPAADAAGSP
jgi:hypothetical protein